MENNKNIVFIITFGIILLIISFVLGVNSGENMLMIIPIIIVIGLVGFGIFYYFKIYLKFKNEVVKKVLTEHKNNLKYEYKFNADDDYIEMIKELKIIQAATSFSFTDWIHEVDGQLEYNSFDLRATHTQSTGKSTTTVTDFNGKFYDVKINPDYCNYVLKEEYWKANIPGYEFLELEVIDFNNKLNLYVTDKFEAHKVFTPSVIKDYLTLISSDDYKSYIASVDDHLYIFLYNSESQFENIDGSKEDIINEYNNQFDILKKYLRALNKGL